MANLLCLEVCGSPRELSACESSLALYPAVVWAGRGPGCSVHFSLRVKHPLALPLPGKPGTLHAGGGP